MRFAPGDPARAEIATPLMFWRGPAGVWLFGLALIAAAFKASG